MKIINRTKNTILSENATIADTFLKRIRGLLGKKRFLPGQALIIQPCKTIHTFFMRYSIDLLFIDGHDRVVVAKNNFKPWRISPIFWHGRYAIELPSGVIQDTRTAVGDEIVLK